ncbi:hypothetical protein ABZ816_25965 [Actinosynnema sp. NPDC047251]|uniref:Uncharacterized protein n=1 Tax=Saccharothrix espanaensis (strain ATCC 51144 / DSM 44229 / JCM 9112 / NBRC 15066 / NRRL 15764) TaxID=1179773 RepID=K0K2N3_SACES|nr:hypothetical protein [Saccharothrix espanaensis]CCH31857.1 hypothetical protein BN6_45780 [Saccharothrix espanaensis DSM 44229]
MSKPLNAEDETVERELAQFWLAPGERLLLGLPPIPAHTAARIGPDVRVPHRPLGDVPELDLGKDHWPLPTEHVTADPDVDWVDDRTVGCFAVASGPADAAIRLADHFAHSRGQARLVVSDRRVAAVYPTKLLQKDPQTVFTTYAELPANHLTALDAVFLGNSLGVPPVVRLTFTDGSVLHLRDSLSAQRITRAHTRATTG